MNKARSRRKAARRAPSVRPSATRPNGIWRDFVAGRLPVRRFYEKSGRRYIVVSPAGDESELTERQQQIIAFRSYGETTKRIAVELGVSEPTVIRELNNALAQLGLSSEVELPVLFGTALRSDRRA